MEVVPLNRTLEQELQALLRGASLECLVCGEFVLHAGGMITCPECGSSVRAAIGAAAATEAADSGARAS
jgi:Zn finger protein HypA/HybF involved in hydrogenase expression